MNFHHLGTTYVVQLNEFSCPKVKTRINSTQQILCTRRSNNN